jgi:hypothetical protein
MAQWKNPGRKTRVLSWAAKKMGIQVTVTVSFGDLTKLNVKG